MRWLLLTALLTATPSLALAENQAAGTGTGTEAAAPPDVVKLPPKIATVVAGDPDETLRNTAAFIETEATIAGIRAPTDPALRAALRGEPVAADDGLSALRSTRRGLGLDPRKDLAAYKRIGIITGADALVVVRREGSILVEVFDVSAAQFYEGNLKFDETSAEERLTFIESRADQAQLRWSEPPPPPPQTAAPKVNEPKKPADESSAKRRMKKAWPYLVAGVLLVGGVTYLIIDRRRTDEAQPPLLRFRPGED